MQPTNKRRTDYITFDDVKQDLAATLTSIGHLPRRQHEYVNTRILQAQLKSQRGQFLHAVGTMLSAAAKLETPVQTEDGGGKKEKVPRARLRKPIELETRTHIHGTTEYSTLRDTLSSVFFNLKISGTGAEVAFEGTEAPDETLVATRSTTVPSSMGNGTITDSTLRRRVTVKLDEDKRMPAKAIPDIAHQSRKWETYMKGEAGKPGVSGMDDMDESDDEKMAPEDVFDVKTRIAPSGLSVAPFGLEVSQSNCSAFPSTLHANFEEVLGKQDTLTRQSPKRWLYSFKRRVTWKLAATAVDRVVYVDTSKSWYKATIACILDITSTDSNHQAIHDTSLVEMELLLEPIEPPAVTTTTEMGKTQFNHAVSNFEECHRALATVVNARPWR